MKDVDKQYQNSKKGRLSLTQTCDPTTTVEDSGNLQFKINRMLEAARKEAAKNAENEKDELQLVPSKTMQNNPLSVEDQIEVLDLKR
jgi:hypothetical protein